MFNESDEALITQTPKCEDTLSTCTCAQTFQSVSSSAEISDGEDNNSNENFHLLSQNNLNDLRDLS